MGKRLGLLWILVFAAPLAALLAGGCGGTKHRTVDVSAGEYYAEDEIAKLPDDLKRKYCRTLDAERTRVQQRFETTTAELTETADRITAARAKRDALDRELLTLEAELRTLDDLIAEVRALPTTWKIRPGESLSSISALPEIYNDVDKWWRLYEANKDKVPDPYYTFPDTVIVIPRDWPVK